MNSNSRRGVAALLAVLSLVIAIAVAGVPAIAQPIATASAGLAQSVKRALSLSKAANKRSAAALAVAQKAQQQAGVPGAPGPIGPQGLNGDQGPQGPPGVSGLQVVTGQTNEDASDAKSLTVACPAGKRVFGGGASISGSQDPGIGANVAIGASGPFAADNNSQALVSETSWRVEAHEHTATAEGWQLNVYAICGNVS